MPKAIPPLTLLQEQLTITTRCRVSKIPIACHTVMMNPHDIQVTTLETTDVAKLLNDIPLCMNGEIGKSTPLRPRPQTIGGHGQNLSTADQHSNVETNQVCLPKPHGIRVIEELLNECIITLTDGPGHIEGSCGRSRGCVQVPRVICVSILRQ